MSHVRVFSILNLGAGCQAVQRNAPGQQTGVPHTPATAIRMLTGGTCPGSGARLISIGRPAAPAPNSKI
eukprot:12552176-Alexandrium_andersonii.AAC.1